MKNKTLKQATDIEEKITDALQNLLDIAKGNSDIENWNEEVENLMKVVNKEIQEAEKRGEKNFVAKEEVRKIIHSLKDLQITREDDLTSLVNKLLIWRDIKLESLK